MIREASEFEIDAIALKETETALLRMKAGIAFEAKDREASNWLAHLWGCSAQVINRLAQIFEVFNDNEILPHVPLSLYGAVMDIARNQNGVVDSAKAAAWLEQALAEGWSSRQVKDRAGLIKGKHLSSTKFEATVEVTTWDITTGGLSVIGFPVSGDMPKRARVTVREELLDDKSTS